MDVDAVCEIVMVITVSLGVTGNITRTSLVGAPIGIAIAVIWIVSSVSGGDTIFSF